MALGCLLGIVSGCGGTTTQVRTVVPNAPGAPDVGYSRQCTNYHYVIGPDGRRHREPCNQPAPPPGPQPNPVPVPSPGGGALGPAAGPVVDHHINPTCGTEYWDQKTLTDSQAASISATPKVSTVSQLAGTAPPSQSSQAAGFNHPPRFGADLQVWRLPVTLVGFKQETDSDIHLVVGDGQKTMIVELPNPACVAHDNAVAKAATTQAYNTFVTACSGGSSGALPSGYTPLSGNAVVQGPGFFDKDHGQTGRANIGNGWDIELHPLTGFSTSGCQQAAAALPTPAPGSD